MGRFLAKYDCLGVWERQNTCWEAIALAAGVDLPYLLGAALLARRDDATTRAKLIAICHAPELLKKRVEYAMLPASGEIAMLSISWSDCSDSFVFSCIKGRKSVAAIHVRLHPWPAENDQTSPSAGNFPGCRYDSHLYPASVPSISFKYRCSLRRGCHSRSSLGLNL